VGKVISNYKPTSKYFDDENNADAQITDLMLSMTIDLDDLMKITEKIKREEKKKICDYLMENSMNLLKNLMTIQKFK
jgi:hypothetical protein